MFSSVTRTWSLPTLQNEEHDQGWNEKDSNFSLTDSIPGTVSDSADSSLRSISPCLFYSQTSLRQVKYFAFSFKGKTSVALFNRTIIQACFQQVTKAVGRSLWRGINQDSLGGKKEFLALLHLPCWATTLHCKINFFWRCSSDISFGFLVADSNLYIYNSRSFEEKESKILSKHPGGTIEATLCEWFVSFNHFSESSH